LADNTNTASAHAILYNLSAGSLTVESQSTAIYGRGTVETYAGPLAVTNTGLMYGGSSDHNPGYTGLVGDPTVWQNGNAYLLPTPNGATNGKVNSANDSGQAVGEMKQSSAGDDQAVYFEWHGVNNPFNNAYFLTQTGGAITSLDTAWAINNAGQIVGQANQANEGAGRLPFYLSAPDANSASVIPPPAAYSTYNGGIAWAISQNGLVAGDYTFNQSANYISFIYNTSTNVTTPILVPGGGTSTFITARGINDSGEVVGRYSTAYSVPFLFDGTQTYDLQNLLVNNQSGAWQLDTTTSASANSIADNGDIFGVGNYNGSLTAFVMVPTGSSLGPQTLTFNNAGGTGDGVTWDTTQNNFNNGTGVTSFSSTNSDQVYFTDVNNGHYNVSIPSTVTPGLVVFNNSAGNYTFSGAGGIAGGASLYKYGAGTVTLNTVNTYTGPTNIIGGVVILGILGALPATTTLHINGTGTSAIAKSLGAAYALQLKSVDVSSSATLDLMNNSLILNGSSISYVESLVAQGYNNGNWNSNGGGTGITTSLAGPSHPLMALGAIVNDNGSGTPLYGSGGAIASSFSGASPSDGDVLVKWTYYGDTNLDGKVDGTDYAAIDNAYLADQAYLASNPQPSAQSPLAIPYTGWQNGDFNYDSVYITEPDSHATNGYQTYTGSFGEIDGSDYTLIDNAFNNQGAVINAQFATSTAQIAGSTVPEPAAISLLLIPAAMLSRRRLHVIKH
jgi:autotransporter-associated beta strand protein